MGKTITTGYLNDTINGIKIKSDIKSHPGNYSNDNSRDIYYVVMHFTGNDDDTAIGNAKYFNREDVDVSAHFFVDETQIYQSVELRDVAWHCGTKKTYYHATCRNANSIGIEMTTDGAYKVSAKTIENSAYLCAHLCEMLNIKSSEVDTYVLRHYDVTHKECPAQMVKNPKEWTAFKTMVKNILDGKPITGTTNVTTKKPSATSFFPSKGYFKKGDTGKNVEKINDFFYKVFPSYAKTLKRDKENLPGNLFGENTLAWVKEFQKRTGLTVDGYIGPLTVKEMEKFGFKK
jgi:N-acetylmuramoyl-L-alanine amidase CwlA